MWIQWLRYQLPQLEKSISDLQKLSDPSVLIALIETLSRKPFPSKQPQESMSSILQFLADEDVPTQFLIAEGLRFQHEKRECYFANFRSAELACGTLETIRELLWRLTVHYLLSTQIQTGGAFLACSRDFPRFFVLILPMQ